eukprot:g3003.t1
MEVDGEDFFDAEREESSGGERSGKKGFSRVGPQQTASFEAAGWVMAAAAKFKQKHRMKKAAIAADKAEKDTRWLGTFDEELAEIERHADDLLALLMSSSTSKQEARPCVRNLGIGTIANKVHPDDNPYSSLYPADTLDTSHISRGHALIIGEERAAAKIGENLCRSGIGRLTIICSGKVTENMVREGLFYDAYMIGMPCARAIAQKLSDISPDIWIRAIHASPAHNAELQNALCILKGTFVLVHASVHRHMTYSSHAEEIDGGGGNIVGADGEIVESGHADLKDPLRCFERQAFDQTGQVTEKVVHMQEAREGEQGPKAYDVACLVGLDSVEMKSAEAECMRFGIPHDI